MDYLLLITCIIPGVIILGVGLILKFFPPKERNLWYGYRTAIAYRSEETWRKSQQLGGLVLIVAGSLSVILSAAVSTVYVNRPEIVVPVTAGAIVLLLFLSILCVEIYLRRIFDEKGERRRGKCEVSASVTRARL